jgi:hypothetical protein
MYPRDGVQETRESESHRDLSDAVNILKVDEGLVGPRYAANIKLVGPFVDCTKLELELVNPCIIVGTSYESSSEPVEIRMPMVTTTSFVLA